MKIKINETEAQLKKLSAHEMLMCLSEYKKTLSSLCFDEEERELAEALSEYGALASFALKKDGERVFESGISALCALSVDKLCFIYDCYRSEAQKSEVCDEDI